MKKSEGRVECEVDDIIRLYKANQITALQHVGEVLSERLVELSDSVEGKWSEQYGTGVEIGEHLILGAFTALMRDYLAGVRTGKENKVHDENCLLKGII